jgi:hypothetical protein
MNGMSFSERLGNGGMMALIGMTITISTLVVLALVINYGTKALRAATGGGAPAGGGGAAGGGGPAKAALASSAAQAPASPSGAGAGAAPAAGAAKGAPAGASGTAQGQELAAVIAAAVAAFLGDGAAPFRVVSFRRTGQTAPAWNLRGREEYLSGKL